MYAPAPKGLPYNWLPVGDQPPHKPDCTCKRLINGQWVSIAAEHRLPTNPFHRDPWPNRRQGRRDAIMARQDNVLTWATPYGFVKAFDLDATQPGLARELELEYLRTTQDRELAPIWLEMRENGIDAVSQSSAISASGDDDTTFADAIKDGNEALYTTPEDARRELWWRVEDEYRWECGPPIKARYIPKAETGVTIRCLEQGSLTKAQSTDWLNAVVAEDREHERIPAREMLVGAVDELRARRAYYGDNWALSLMAPEEIDTFPQYERINKFLNEWDADPMRHAFDTSDTEKAYQATRPEYAGNGSLGFDDWDMLEMSYYEDLDFDPEKVSLYELGEWGD